MYHDTGILAMEIERLFRREWICIGRTAEIPEPGDYLCRELVDIPLFVVRQRDGTVKSFVNVCLHRASPLLEGAGHASRISCPYHSWTYGIDGRLIGAPFMHEAAGFDVGAHRLKEINCATWEGFVYVCLEPEARPVGARLDGLSDQIGDYRMADYQPVFAAEETWDTNWKCLVENFMDAYHVHRVHRDSFAKHGSSEARTTLLDGEDAYTCHHVQEDSGAKSVHPDPENSWLGEDNRHRTWLINVFPSHTIQLQPDMLWYLSILPRGVDQVHIRWAVSIPREILRKVKVPQAAIDDVMGLLHQVNSEDRPIVENVFRATRSPEARQGPLSHLERNVWQFGRYLARRLCC